MWYDEKKEVVLRKLRSSEKGLSEKEADIRLKRHGKNLIKEIYKINPWKIFFLQFKSWLIYILIAAIIVSIIIEHYIDSGVIFAIVLLNAFIGFFQQYKAEKSVLELRKILTPKVKVMRNGKLKIIKAEELVRGDILVLKSGDKIPADCRILKVINLEVNEAVLT